MDREKNQENEGLKQQLALLTNVVRGLSKTVEELQTKLRKDYNIIDSNIDQQDNNFAKVDEEVIHQSPPEGATCAALWEDINDTNYCEYQTSAGKWHPCVYCEEVVREMQDTQFENYKKNVEKSTCKAQMRSLVQAGPPIWISDQAMPVDNEDEYIAKLWFSSTKSTVSAKLKGALESKERDQLWNRYMEFYSLLPENDND